MAGSIAWRRRSHRLCSLRSQEPPRSFVMISAPGPRETTCSPRCGEREANGSAGCRQLEGESRCHSAKKVILQIRYSTLKSRVLSNQRHRLSAVCAGKRCFGRDRCRRQRGVLSVSRCSWGGGSTPSRGGRARSGQGFELRARRRSRMSSTAPLPVDAPAASLHTSADRGDGADGSLQPAPFARPTTVSLVAVEPGPPAGAANSSRAGS